MQDTKIEWTNMTWNPVTGCTKVGPGCDHCYAEVIAERYRGKAFPNGFDLTPHPERLDQPKRKRKPQMIFVNSMSDLFHKDIPHDYIDKIFDVMEGETRHVFQVLTKRSSTMRDYVAARYQGAAVPSHIWFGVSVEDRERTSRIAHLKQINSPARFISFEPLLGPVGDIDLTGIAWAIVGGESGHGSRPMHADWAREIRDICQRDGVAFLFKQWGGRTPKANGRTLDGRTWDEYPMQVVPAVLAESMREAMESPQRTATSIAAGAVT